MEQFKLDGNPPPSGKKKRQVKDQKPERLGQSDVTAPPPAETQAPDAKPESGAPRADSTTRMFYPANREDALLLLGGMCLSACFPDNSVALAMREDGLALLEGGIRASEESLLNGGKHEKFPVLIEVDPAHAHDSPRVIGYDRIKGLVFRSQVDADDFRFRPVDEFDAETALGTSVAPECFGLSGDPRFSVVTERAAQIRIGYLADRLAAGVHTVLELGRQRPDCRGAVTTFLSAHDGSQEGKGELGWDAAWRIACDEGATSQLPRTQHVVVSSFLHGEGAGPAALVAAIEDRFSATAGADERSREIENRWSAVARDVIRSRIALDGDRLSDEKSVLFRAALLALMVDDVDAVRSFLDAEKPAGVRVATNASFLVGIKQGVLSLPWKAKKKHVSTISVLLVSFLRSLMACESDSAKMLAVSSKATDEGQLVSVTCGDVDLAAWIIPKEREIAPATREWLEHVRLLGYEILGNGRTAGSWKVSLPGDQLVEVTPAEVGQEAYAVLRFYLETGQKLRKAKEFEDYSRKGGTFWHPGPEVDGCPSLSCDLLLLPEKGKASLISRTLEDARTQYAAAGKPSRKRKATTPASKPRVKGVS